MPILAKVKDRVAGNIERKIESWRPVQGEHAQRVKSIEAAYLILVLFGMLIALGYSGGSGFGVLAVLAMTFALASDRFVKPVAVRAIYDGLASKFGWPGFEAGYRQDQERKQEGERIREENIRSGKREPGLIEKLFRPQRPDEPSAAPKVDPVGPINDTAKQILSAWAGLPKSRRSARALEVVNALNPICKHAALDVVEDADAEQKPIAADTALRMLCREYTIELKPEIA